MTDEILYPWHLEPKLTTAVWGGSDLVRVYGKNAAPKALLGESWECWDADAVDKRHSAGLDRGNAA
jgi:hypothetical protein